MLATIYLFGELGNGYTQYLDDHTTTMFKGFASKVKANTQLMIHREDNAVYYAYIRRLADGKRYMGMCYVISGVLIKDIHGLFTIFEKALTYLVNDGTILRFLPDGSISANIDKLFKAKAEFGMVSAYLKEQLSNLDKRKIISLPPVDYNINSDESKLFNITDELNDIQRAIAIYPYVYIFKDKEYDTLQLNSYKGILARLNKENRNLRTENADVNAKYRKERAKNKQMMLVFLLSLILVGCGIGLYFLYDNLDNTQNQLTEANKNIEEKTNLLEDANQDISNKEKIIENNENTISMLQGAVSNLEDSVKRYKELYQSEQENRHEIEDNYDTFKGSVSSIQPLLIRGTSYAFETGKYKISYYGISSGRYNLTFRVIFPDTSTKDYERSVYVYTGYDNLTVNINDGFDKNKYYVIQIMYNGHVIGGSRH